MGTKEYQVFRAEVGSGSGSEPVVNWISVCTVYNSQTAFSFVEELLRSGHAVRLQARPVHDR